MLSDRKGEGVEVSVVMMSEVEAKECVDKINSNMTNIRALVLDLHEREGWKALHYQSWRECVTAEFGKSQPYLYFQLEAAKAERNISTIVENASTIPESQLRPLTKLRNEPEKQKEAWQKAVETAPEGKVTAAHVYKIVKGMENQGKGPESTPQIEESDALFQLKRWWKKATKKDKKIFLDWTKGVMNNE